MAGLLKGVKVVETGVLMVVDYLGRLLGDEGADVVKVESPQLGDYLRNILSGFGPDWSTKHMMLNRNKRSLTCDAKTVEGREILSRLIAEADVFITGNIGDTNDRLGLDYQSVKAINPDIVYCQATGFGASGPYSAVPTHGNMMDALGGGAAPMAVDDGGFVVATGDPVGSSPGVVLGPLYAAVGVLAGLVRARTSGEGCYIDVSCADAVIASKWLFGLEMLNPAKVDPAMNRATGDGSGSSKYQFYETKDGKFILFCAIEAKFWTHWCEAVGRPDLLGEHRSDLVVDFGDGDANLRLEIQKVFHTKTQTEWMEIAIDHDTAMGPALRFDEIQTDPHLEARQQIVTEQHPVFGDILTFGEPILVPGEEFHLRSAPTHGQHTEEVLMELGYDEGAVVKLRTAGIV